MRQMLFKERNRLAGGSTEAVAAFFCDSGSEITLVACQRQMQFF